MKACDACPGAEKCSGLNLKPVLVRVFDLYAGGQTDKFAILEALDDEDEAILERYTVNVSRTCWTKAALLAIVQVVSRLSSVDQVYDTIATAHAAFSRFPWQVNELVEQAPDLHALILEQCPDADMCDKLTKRAFVKACKSIAFA